MCGAHGAKEATESRDHITTKTPEAQGVRGLLGHQEEAAGRTVLSCTRPGPARGASAALGDGGWVSGRSAEPWDEP